MTIIHPGEKIIRVVHRHWIVVAQKMTMVAFLILVPIVGLFLLPLFVIPEALAALAVYLFSLYTLFIAVIAFGMWMDYYLDIWIITSERIIDIEHKGVFNREVSEFMMERVQDVTTHNPNFLSLLLGYGTIEVHTAGEKTFVGHDLPNVKEIKDIIIETRMKRA
ncbi:MAG: hypothetical protein COU47_02500 [Candidatus Niyogibacteria bacterium CG10_big_fil_rev_8_21_14_0_10_46_36]|uniref:YdbS-like PH domain-containing protein n=1 Tax=Candidatus Niyogibacteria bacterium CG10_big_fil_rev_8_21_14_0_10_46_36 TaxID=1974726 RepID=A0A2H0TDH8_9BACT|nr:MAG: hypothetical protein COU47_02500 [Candidatus Niyogibacteria bacterium CG10_big_fil_rev_8_21_14_0_10_46_36]